MPGGRLTSEDRNRLAAGLAAGAGFAEIARSLGRPTSTITREVARNGGRDGYHPDLAHRATERRARRRRTRPRPAVPPPADHGRDPVALHDFVERFSALMARTGLPRMTTRVLTSLFVSDSGSATSADLVGRLRVSPASVSKAIGHLEELALIRRERDPSGRRERYFVDQAVWPKAWTASARKHLTFADLAREGVAILGPSTPAGARMREMGEFFGGLADEMAGSTSADAAEDIASLVAALVHVGQPVTPPQLAAALGWSVDRCSTALRAAESRQRWTDPIAIRHGPDGYAVEASPSRLADEQRQALDALARRSRVRVTRRAARHRRGRAR